jgi:hypothetical protein
VQLQDARTYGRQRTLLHPTGATWSLDGLTRRTAVL